MPIQLSNSQPREPKACRQALALTGVACTLIRSNYEKTNGIFAEKKLPVGRE